MSFYRFRPVDALLDTFHELENQEIYFASPRELNDPLEGFMDLVWCGDTILWENFLRHYLLCLTDAVMDALIHGPDHVFTAIEDFIFLNQSSLPTPERNELHCRIYGDFFNKEGAAALPKLLASRIGPIRRAELTTYLRLLHLCALDTVLTRVEELTHMTPRPANDPLHVAGAKPVAISTFMELLKGHERANPDKPDIAEEVCENYEISAVELELISEYNGISLKCGVAWKMLISEFPRTHVRALAQLLYRDWYTACFVADPTHASMWGTYGNKHRGVCLKFKATATMDGKPSIQLRQICGSNGTPIYGDVTHEFHQVQYSSQFIEINFFRSLGRLAMPQLRHWYRDAAGVASSLVSDILSESSSWRKQYWDQQLMATSTKLADWEHEQEFRLILTGLSDFSEKSTRKLQYQFSDLEGIIFGMNTPTSDKLRIIKKIEEKCRSLGRRDFEFHQAHYSRQAGKLKISKMALINFA